MNRNLGRDETTAQIDNNPQIYEKETVPEGSSKTNSENASLTLVLKHQNPNAEGSPQSSQSRSPTDQTALWTVQESFAPTSGPQMSSQLAPKAAFPPPHSREGEGLRQLRTHFESPGSQHALLKTSIVSELQLEAGRLLISGSCCWSNWPLHGECQEMQSSLLQLRNAFSLHLVLLLLPLLVMLLMGRPMCY
jgi:hypothetical protein